MNNGTAVFSLRELFSLGGLFMWPLFVFSVAELAIILDRAAFLVYYRLRIDRLAGQTRDFIRSGNFAGAETFLKERTKRDMGARVLLTLVRHAGFSERRLEKAAETEAQSCVNALEAGFNFLAAIGSLAPLTGFLGTVSGMIGAFHSISRTEQVNAQTLAGGMYEALITTAFGLVIAVVAMSAYYLFESVADRFAARTEKTCSEMITALAQRNVRTADAAPRAGAGHS
jgi:biopolymer transport protein ExbB